MAGTSTRLLLLGATMLFEPINGYQIRRELVSWRVDEWAHLNPGSIYSGLDTLVRQDCLTRHVLREGQRDVSVYTTTGHGRREFRRLFEHALLVIDQTSTIDLAAALALQPLVAREEFRGLLRRRLDLLETTLVDQADEQVLADLSALPPHLPMLKRLWIDMALVERTWLIDVLAAVDRGEFEYAGEPETWLPPTDDPGLQIMRERERYREMLGLR